MKKTKIICTIGPKSDNEEVLTELINSGLNLARLNFSHGDHSSHQKTIDLIKSVREKLKRPVAIVLDTKGPEIRTGKFSLPEVKLSKGDTYTFTTRDIVGDENICMVNYSGFIDDISIGDKVLVDDGLLELKVIEKLSDTDVKLEVQNNGIIKNNKGINLPSIKVNLPAMTERDKSDILFGIKNGVDYIAASFIRKAEDVQDIRRILENNGGKDIGIISKIENEEGVSNIDEIISVSDGIMVARGDLGVEIPIQDVPIIQKKIINKCNEIGKPVVTATQMLDSMIRNPRPTRAESTDVANAILDGTDAIMLSGETASGDYPIEAVKVMATIAEAAESMLDYERILYERERVLKKDVTFAVSQATVSSSNSLNAEAIITATSSGFTAKKISNLRPRAKIIASCTCDRVRRMLSLYWGVNTIPAIKHDNIEEIFEYSVNKSIEEGHIKKGDMIVFTAGVPVGVSGATNLMRIHLVGEVLLKAVGIGNSVITGKARVIDKPSDFDGTLEQGEILVVKTTSKEIMHLIEKSTAMIVEEGGLTSHAAIVGLNLNKPTIIGAKDAMSKIEDGKLITLDSEKGIVYSGRTRVL